MKKTDLFDAYSDNKDIVFTEFGDWELPLHFGTGIITEHMAVRKSMFDVSHMGECFISGSSALKFLNLMLTNDITSLNEGRAIYTLMCYENGNTVDDLIIYRLNAGKDEVYKFFVVMNASNVEKDLKHLNSYKDKFEFNDLIIENVSSLYCQIALQGPSALSFIEKNFNSFYLNKFFSCKELDGYIIGRTGYTGENGFEFYIKEKDLAISLWKEFKKYGIKECGLGSRDTLRLEAKLPLYGHELSDSISPLESNLGIFVKLDKKVDFIGKKALVSQAKTGIPRSLRGFKVKNGVARNSNRIFYSGKDIGYVTSGGVSPVLNEFICLGLIDRSTHLKFGDTVYIDINGRKKEAVLCKTPFVEHVYSDI